MPDLTETPHLPQTAAGPAYQQPIYPQPGFTQSSFQNAGQPSLGQDPFLEGYPPRYQSASNPDKTQDWKTYATMAAMVALILFCGYQQIQINSLSRDVGIMSNSMRTSDVPARLDAAENKLDDVNNRLKYLDSKIAATDQKAQAALAQLKANENSGNIFGNFLNSVGKSLGLNK